MFGKNKERHEGMKALISLDKTVSDDTYICTYMHTTNPILHGQSIVIIDHITIPNI